MSRNDPVQEYLDRLRSMSPNEKLSRDIEEIEQEHRRKLDEERPRRKIKTGFRPKADH